MSHPPSHADILCGLSSREKEEKKLCVGGLSSLGIFGRTRSQINQGKEVNRDDPVGWHSGLS